MRRLLTGVWLSVAVLPRIEAGDLAEIRKRGTLRALVVVSEEEAYFVSSKPDAPPGFDAEVLEGFARLHKLKLTIVPVSGWDALIPSLLKGGNLRRTPTWDRLVVKYFGEAASEILRRARAQ